MFLCLLKSTLLLQLPPSLLLLLMLLIPVVTTIIFVVVSVNILVVKATIFCQRLTIIVPPQQEVSQLPVSPDVMAAMLVYS